MIRLHPVAALWIHHLRGLPAPGAGTDFRLWAAEQPVFCDDCRDHGLLQLRKAAALRSRQKRFQERSRSRDRRSGGEHRPPASSSDLQPATADSTKEQRRWEQEGEALKASEPCLVLLAFLNKLLFDEMYHFALQASPGSWGQLARLGFNEESGEDHFSEFLQAGEALLEEGEHRRAASQVPPATAWRIRKYSFKRAEPPPPAAGISGVPPGALCGQGSVAPQPDLSDPPPIEGPEQLLTEAMRLFTQGKVSKAMFCLSRSLWIADSGEAAAVPSSLISILHSNRALERLQLQQWTGAEDDCTVAVTLNPRNAKARWAGDGGARSRCG